jgi:uncharacterized lipoprotein YmbA
MILTRLQPLALIALAGALLTSCGTSAPIRYYTLAQIPADSGAVATASGSPLRIERVSIPAELDRLGVSWHVAANRVEIADQDRWAAPLEEMIRRTLSADLSARLPAGSVVDPHEPPTTEPRRVLFVQIGSLYADERCAVTLDAHWTLETTGAPARRASESVAAAPVAPCPGGLAAGLSRALADLSDKLAQALAR